ncbi:hypothetical protein F4859DRAFT_469855 [Xylaria cf. heliscus]|nr:hypothetical protein F4859DRAFT_469855 [Xylaria cf. heliscus]
MRTLRGLWLVHTHSSYALSPSLTICLELSTIDRQINYGVASRLPREACSLRLRPRGMWQTVLVLFGCRCLQNGSQFVKCRLQNRGRAVSSRRTLLLRLK